MMEDFHLIWKPEIIIMLHLGNLLKATENLLFVMILIINCLTTTEIYKDSYSISLCYNFLLIHQYIYFIPTSNKKCFSD